MANIVDTLVDRIIKIKKQYPELTFDNDGYEYLSREVREKHKEQIKEIESILKQIIERFSEFNNFVPRKDGSFDVRCQYGWDAYFTGVGYFSMSELRTAVIHED